MLHFAAQTMPAAQNPSAWTPGNVVLVIGAIATVLIPSVIALIKAWKAESSAAAAAAGAVQNHGALTEQRAKINEITKDNPEVADLPPVPPLPGPLTQLDTDAANEPKPK